MKKSILVVCSIVAFAGVTATAQQPQPQTPPTQQTPPDPPSQRPPDPATPRPTDPTTPRPTDPTTASPSSRPSTDMASTTVTGCLKTWDSRTMAPATGSGSGAGSAASPTASASASTPSASDFVLTNVEGARASSGAAGKGSFLLKTSDASISFSQHLNHKVSVTGTLADAASGMGRGSDRMSDQPTADKPGATRDASASGRVSAGDAKLPILTVTSLKMVSPTCGS